ncbi:M23 family metallopeptidase, partial [Micromonospora sp. MW-13]|uniref:M23 family metallopeptidase n=2 Tax=unclassified Micromonospora TaxID=2617518 RepID=UPI001A9DD67F
MAAGAVTAIGAGADAAVAAVPGFYNPFTGYPITETWQGHLNRGSLGGIDYGMSVGTRLPAAGGGVVTNNPNNGTGGYTVTIQHDNGYRTQYLHLSQFLLPNGTRVGAGEVVGLSGGAAGAPGSGSSTGPHLHWHMVDPSGTRINPLVFLDGDE